MIDAQSLDLLTEPLIIPTPGVQSLHKYAAAPATTLTINTGLSGLGASPALAAPAPTLKAVSTVPSSTRRFLGPGLTRMHPYYYVQYVPLDLKHNLVCSNLHIYTYCVLFNITKLYITYHVTCVTDCEIVIHSFPPICDIFHFIIMFEFFTGEIFKLLSLLYLVGTTV